MRGRQDGTSSSARPHAALPRWFAVGLFITVAIEKWAISVGRWQYTEAMPTIAGIGLSPLLQWIIIPTLIVFFVRRVTASILSK